MDAEWEFLGLSSDGRYELYRKPIAWDKQGNPTAYDRKSEKIDVITRQVQAK